MINVIDAAGNIQSIGTLPDLGPTTVASGLPIAGVSDNIIGTITAANANYLATTVSTTPAPTTGSFVEITTTGYNNLVIQVSNTTVSTAFIGTMVVQGTVDGINWITLSSSSRLQTYAGTVAATGITTAGIYIADVTGLQKARVTSTTATFTNSASVYLEVTSSSGLPAVLGAISTLSVVSVVTLANLGFPQPASTTPDVATTTTLTSNTTTASATITPTYGCSYEVNIPVTVFTGTGLSLDVIIQESDDSGATTGGWFDVYQFERITAVGNYRSPKLPLTGNRIRYVQIVTGTITTLTRAINRLQSSDTVVPIRRFFDRSLNSAQALNAVTTGNTVVSSVTYPYTMGNPSKNVQLIVSTATLGGTPPAFRLQGSEDGTNWYDLSAASLTATSGTVQQTVTSVRAPQLRAYVTTAGVGTTLNYICIKAYD